MHKERQNEKDRVRKGGDGMDNISEEQSKLLADYEDMVEVKIRLPRSKIEMLASGLQRDMLTLSAQSFDPDAEKVNTVKLRARLARDLSYFFQLLDTEDSVEEEPPKQSTSKKKSTAKNPRRTRKTAPAPKD